MALTNHNDHPTKESRQRADKIQCLGSNLELHASHPELAAEDDICQKSLPL